MGLPKSPKNQAVKQNSIFSKGCHFKKDQQTIKNILVPKIDLASLDSSVKVIDLIDSPLNLNTQPMSRNYLQPRGGTAILDSTPRLQVDLDKS
jgi:hypothetical protein